MIALELQDHLVRDIQAICDKRNDVARRRHDAQLGHHQLRQKQQQQESSTADQSEGKNNGNSNYNWETKKKQLQQQRQQWNGKVSKGNNGAATARSCPRCMHTHKRQRKQRTAEPRD